MIAAVRTGVRVGVDVGTVRVGLAVCDPAGLLATPLETVPRRDDGGDLDRICAICAETGAVEVVIGLPRSMHGGESHAAGKARAYAAELAARLGATPVRLVDERLSTVTAHRALARVPGRARREVVDQAAAVEILQAALDAERSSGRLGELVQARP